ncbi:MAG: NAD(P)H-dependent oxidoreductase [Pseudomonadota bacterium]
MQDTNSSTVLFVSASARGDGSLSRTVGGEVLDALRAKHGEITVIERDLRSDLPFVSETWMTGAFTPEDQRSDAQNASLSTSLTLVDELKTADMVVIATPMYNFTIPASLKAWIDQVARAGLTFKYSESGPVGLLDDKPTIVVSASGGTELGGPIDFLTNYMSFILGFMGLKSAKHVQVNLTMADQDKALAGARAQIPEAIGA